MPRRRDFTEAGDFKRASKRQKLSERRHVDRHPGTLEGHHPSAFSRLRADSTGLELPATPVDHGDKVWGKKTNRQAYESGVLDIPQVDNLTPREREDLRVPASASGRYLVRFPSKVDHKETKHSTSGRRAIRIAHQAAKAVAKENKLTKFERAQLQHVMFKVLVHEFGDDLKYFTQHIPGVFTKGGISRRFGNGEKTMGNQSNLHDQAVDMLYGVFKPLAQREGHAAGGSKPDVSWSSDFQNVFNAYAKRAGKDSLRMDMILSPWQHSKKGIKAAAKIWQLKEGNVQLRIARVAGVFVQRHYNQPLITSRRGIGDYQREMKRAYERAEYVVAATMYGLQLDPTMMTTGQEKLLSEVITYAWDTVNGKHPLDPKKSASYLNSQEYWKAVIGTLSTTYVDANGQAHHWNAPLPVGAEILPVPSMATSITTQPALQAEVTKLALAAKNRFFKSGTKNGNLLGVSPGDGRLTRKERQDAWDKWMGAYQTGYTKRHSPAQPATGNNPPAPPVNPNPNANPAQPQNNFNAPALPMMGTQVPDWNVLNQMSSLGQYFMIWDQGNALIPAQPVGNAAQARALIDQAKQTNAPGFAIAVGREQVGANPGALVAHAYMGGTMAASAERAPILYQAPGGRTLFEVRTNPQHPFTPKNWNFTSDAMQQLNYVFDDVVRQGPSGGHTPDVAEQHAYAEVAKLITGAFFGTTMYLNGEPIDLMACYKSQRREMLQQQAHALGGNPPAVQYVVAQGGQGGTGGPGGQGGSGGNGGVGAPGRGGDIYNNSAHPYETILMNRADPSKSLRIYLRGLERLGGLNQEEIQRLQTAYQAASNGVSNNQDLITLATQYAQEAARVVIGQNVKVKFKWLTAEEYRAHQGQAVPAATRTPVAQPQQVDITDGPVAQKASSIPPEMDWSGLKNAPQPVPAAMRTPEVQPQQVDITDGPVAQKASSIPPEMDWSGLKNAPQPKKDAFDLPDDFGEDIESLFDVPEKKEPLTPLKAEEKDAPVLEEIIKGMEEGTLEPGLKPVNPELKNQLDAAVAAAERAAEDLKNRMADATRREVVQGGVNENLEKLPKVDEPAADAPPVPQAKNQPAKPRDRRRGLSPDLLDAANKVANAMKGMVTDALANMDRAVTKAETRVRKLPPAQQTKWVEGVKDAQEVVGALQDMTQEGATPDSRRNTLRGVKRDGSRARLSDIFDLREDGDLSDDKVNTAIVANKDKFLEQVHGIAPEVPVVSVEAAVEALLQGISSFGIGDKDKLGARIGEDGNGIGFTSSLSLTTSYSSDSDDEERTQAQKDEARANRKLENSSATQLLKKLLGEKNPNHDRTMSMSDLCDGLLAKLKEIPESLAYAEKFALNQAIGEIPNGKACANGRPQVLTDTGKKLIALCHKHGVLAEMLEQVKTPENQKHRGAPVVQELLLGIQDAAALEAAQKVAGEKPLHPKKQGGLRIDAESQKQADSIKDQLKKLLGIGSDVEAKEKDGQHRVVIKPKGHER